MFLVPKFVILEDLEVENESPKDRFGVELGDCWIWVAT